MGAAAMKNLATISVQVENRSTGIYISSEDVPGLWLWGTDSEQVFDDIIPTIRELYKLNRGLDVEVRPVQENVTRSARLCAVEKMPCQFNIFEAKENKNHSGVNG